MPPSMTDNIFSTQICGSDNLKAFSAALSFLRSVGKELQVEVSPESMVLRALNDSKTAYASVEFQGVFFHGGNFHLNVNMMREIYGTHVPSQTDNSFSCKLPIKYMCGLSKSFRNATSLCMSAQSGADGKHELVLELRGQYNIKRTHRFKYSDCEIVSAVFDEEGSCSVRAMNKVLMQLLEHIHGAPEVVVTASPSSFKVKSHHRATASASLADAKKHLSTDLSVAIEDFDFYDFSTSAYDRKIDFVSDGALSLSSTGEPFREVIVSKREWRSLLQLGEAIGCDDVAVNFINQGQPIKVLIQHECLVATLIMTSIQVQSAAAAQASQTAAATQSSTSQSPQKAASRKKTAAASKERRRKATEKRNPSPPSDQDQVNSEEKEEENIQRDNAYCNDDDDRDDRDADQMVTNSISPERIARSVERVGDGKNIAKRIVVDSDEDEEDITQPELEPESRPEPQSHESNGKRKMRRLSKTGDTARALLGLQHGGGNGGTHDSPSQSLSQDSEIELHVHKKRSPHHKNHMQSWDDDDD